VAMPMGTRVRLLNVPVPQQTVGKAGARGEITEGRIVASPVPPVWAVPLPLRNVSALREAVGAGFVTVQLSASDQVRVAPDQYVAALF